MPVAGSAAILLPIADTTVLDTLSSLTPLLSKATRPTGKMSRERRSCGLKTFVYKGQSKGQIPEDVEHLIVDSSIQAIPPEAFCGIKSLTKVEIELGVKTIGYRAFSGCSNLTEVVIPSTVVEIGCWAFWGCAFQKVVLPTGITGIGRYAFSFCETLTEITIPSTVLEIGIGAFAACKSLTSVDLHMGLQRIGSNAFWHCSALEKVEIPSTVANFGLHVFHECGNLQSIGIKGGNNLPLAIRLSTTYPTTTPNITMSSLVSQYFFHRMTALDLLEPEQMENEGEKLEEIKSAFVEHLRLLVEWRVCSGNFTNRKRKAED